MAITSKRCFVHNKNIYICSGNQNTSASSWDFFFQKNTKFAFPGEAEKINHLWHLWYICNPKLVASRYRARRVRRINKHSTKKKRTSPSFVWLTLHLCDRDPTTRATCAFLLSSCLGQSWAQPWAGPGGRTGVFHGTSGTKFMSGHCEGTGRTSMDKYLCESIEQCSCSCLEIFHEAQECNTYVKRW